MAKLLIECGADPTAFTAQGYNCLHFVALTGSREWTEFLVEKCKINIHSMTNDGKVAYTIATSMGDIEYANYLRDRFGAKPVDVFTLIEVSFPTLPLICLYSYISSGGFNRRSVRGRLRTFSSNFEKRFLVIPLPRCASVLIGMGELEA